MLTNVQILHLEKTQLNEKIKDQKAELARIRDKINNLQADERKIAQSFIQMESCQGKNQENLLAVD